MKQKRKEKALLSGKVGLKGGLIVTLLSVLGGVVCLTLLSLQTKSVSAEPAGGETTDVNYVGLNDKVEVVNGLDFIKYNGSTGETLYRMYEDTSNLYLLPKNVVVNDLVGDGETIDHSSEYRNQVNGVYGHVLGGKTNTISSNNVTIIAGERNTVNDGNVNFAILGGEGNVVNSNAGEAGVMIGGDGNEINNGTISGGKGIIVAAGGSSSSILGGENNEVKSSNAIVGGSKVVARGGIPNIFAFSNKNNLEMESENAFYLDVKAGLGINKESSAGGVEVKGAVGFGEVNINSGCDYSNFGVQGTWEGCLVSCTAKGWELLDSSDVCKTKCEGNSNCKIGGGDPIVLVDGKCVGGVHKEKADECFNPSEVKKYKNTMFEEVLVDSDEACNVADNKCVYRCKAGTHLVNNPISWWTGRGKGCYDDCGLPWNKTEKVKHGETITAYGSPNEQCAYNDGIKNPASVFTCSDNQRAKLICVDGHWYNDGTHQPDNDTHTNKTCTQAGYSCDPSDYYLTSSFAGGSYYNLYKNGTLVDEEVVFDKSDSSDRKTGPKGKRGQYILCKDFSAVRDGGGDTYVDRCEDAGYHFKLDQCNDDGYSERYSTTVDHPDICLKMCEYNGDWYKDGESMELNNASSVTCPSLCEETTFTCHDGQWDGDVNSFEDECHVNEYSCKDNGYDIGSDILEDLEEADIKDGTNYLSCQSYSSDGVSCEDAGEYLQFAGCNKDYHTEKGKMYTVEGKTLFLGFSKTPSGKDRYCIPNDKTEPCSDKNVPEHADPIYVDVPVEWDDNIGDWTEPEGCEWTCSEHYEPNNEGTACDLIIGGCNLNSLPENGIPNNDEKPTGVASMDYEYSTDMTKVCGYHCDDEHFDYNKNTGACVPKSREVDCDGEIIDNAEAKDNMTGKYSQKWSVTKGAWDPNEKKWSFTNVSECGMRCKGGYSPSNGECVSDCEKKWKVTYDVNGGNWIEKTEDEVYFGESVNLNYKASKGEKGWTFIGWNENPNATEGVKQLQQGCGQTKLYAIYQAPNMCKITFDLKGGKGLNSDNPQNVVCGEKGDKPSPKPTHDDEGCYKFTFTNWYKTSPQDPYDWDTPVNDDIKLYADWNKEGKKYNILYNCKPGEGNVFGHLNVTYGSAVILRDSGCNNSPYKLLGWSLTSGATVADFGRGAEVDITTKLDGLCQTTVTLHAVYGDPNMCNITFVTDGGSEVKSQSVVCGKNGTKPTDPTRTKTCYESSKFAGRYLSGATNAFDFTNTKIDKDITLYAHWTDTPSKYTLSYSCNGGNGQPQTQTITYGKKPLPKVNNGGCSRDGYDLIGWSLSENGTAPVWKVGDEISGDLTAENKCTDNKTLYAVWAEISTHDMYFELYGGKLKSTEQNPQKVIHGSAGTKPGDPEKTAECYENKFVNWYKTSAYATTYVWSTPVTDDITLHAKWNTTTGSYTLTYDCNKDKGGKGGPYTQTVTYGVSAKVKSDGCTPKENWKFIGWNTDKSATSAIWAGGEEIVGDAILGVKGKCLVDKTISAIYIESNKCSITFDSNGGTKVEGQTPYCGQKGTKPADPTRTCYNFDYWYETSESTKYTFTEAVNGNITLHAKWSPKSYTITYDCNGGNGTPGTQTIKFGEQPLKKLRSDGCENGTKPLLGWMDDNGAIYGLGEEISGDLTAENHCTEDKTLYAVWGDSAKCTITFNSNGGSTFAPAGYSNFECGTIKTKPNSNPDKDCNNFGGWYDDEALTKEHKWSDPVTENITLYAKWNVKQYSITFDSNGGTDVATQIVNCGQRGNKPTDPEKQCYTLDYWYKNNNKFDDYNWNNGVYSDIALKANWAADGYTLKYNCGDGSGNPGSQTVIYGYGGTVKSAGCEKDGYDLVGWSLEDYYPYTEFPKGSKYSGVLTDEYFCTDDKTLKAVYKPIETETVTCTMMYDSDGGSPVGSQTVDYGQKRSQPTDPSKSGTCYGYGFAGWYTDTTYSDEFDFINTSSSQTDCNITVYAKWIKTPKEFTLTYYKGNCNTLADGSSSNSYTYTFGENVTFPSDAKPKDGDDFAGWTKDSNPNSSSSTLISYKMACGSDKLYAKCTAESQIATITYHENKCENATPPDSVKVYYTPAVYAANGMKVDDEKYNFIKWCSTSAGGTPCYKGGDQIKAAKTSMSDKDLYGMCNEKTATLSYGYGNDSGCGTLPNDQTMKYSEKATAASGMKSLKSGYKFIKWCENDDGSEPCYNGGAQVKAANKVPENMELYAICEKKKNTLSVDPNGGKVSFDGMTRTQKHSVTKSAGSTVDFDPDSITRDSSLSGCKVKFDGNGGTIDGESSVEKDYTQTKSYTFKEWKEATNSVCGSISSKKYTFPDNDGTTCAMKAYWNSYATTYSNVTPLPSAKWDNLHTFKGWYTSKSGGTKVLDPYEPKSCGVTLYAQWDEFFPGCKDFDSYPKCDDGTDGTADGSDDTYKYWKCGDQRCKVCNVDKGYKFNGSSCVKCNNCAKNGWPYCFPIDFSSSCSESNYPDLTKFD